MIPAIIAVLIAAIAGLGCWITIIGAAMGWWDMIWIEAVLLGVSIFSFAGLYWLGGRE